MKMNETLKEWRERYVHAEASVRCRHRASEGAEPCAPVAVAIMISGQLQRFVWQDQTGPLLAPSQNTDCPVVADVYIALSNTSLAEPFTQRIEDPPYLGSTSIDSIQRWYRLRGARQVIVKLVEEAELIRAEGMKRDLLAGNRRGKKACEHVCAHVYRVGRCWRCARLGTYIDVRVDMRIDLCADMRVIWTVADDLDISMSRHISMLKTAVYAYTQNSCICLHSQQLYMPTLKTAVYAYTQNSCICMSDHCSASKTARMAAHSPRCILLHISVHLKDFGKVFIRIDRYVHAHVHAPVCIWVFVQL